MWNPVTETNVYHRLFALVKALMQRLKPVETSAFTGLRAITSAQRNRLDDTSNPKSLNKF